MDTIVNSTISTQSDLIDNYVRNTTPSKEAGCTERQAQATGSLTSASPLVRPTTSRTHLQVREQLASLHQVQQHVHVGLVLVRPQKVNNERMSALLHGLSLLQHVLRQALALHQELAHRLDCVVFPVPLYQRHSPEGAGAKDCHRNQLREVG